MALPTIRQLEYFVTAARVGTFAGAATEHRIAQPSLSEQIGQLEQTLGVPLFTRTSRGLQLTDAGRQLLPQAEQSLMSVRELSEWSRRLRTVESGRVTFGTFNSAHLYLLTDLVREFRAVRPGVQIQILGANSSGVAEQVRDGAIEAGIVQLPVDDRGLQVSPTMFVDHVVYVSRDPIPEEHLVDGRLDISSLPDRPLILSETSWAMTDPLRVTLLERAQRAGKSLEPAVEVEFQTHALQLAAEGLGDTFVSYHVARSTIEEQGLHWAPVTPVLEEHYAFITRKGGGVSPATGEFMQIAHRLLRQLAAMQPLPR
ncbi:LysR family transcriptional regulator [Leucobacter sp. GX24907]